MTSKLVKIVLLVAVLVVLVTPAVVYTQRQLERQFYRGVYLDCMRMGRVLGVPPQEANTACNQVVREGRAMGAYDLPVPGFVWPPEEIYRALPVPGKGA